MKALRKKSTKEWLEIVDGLIYTSEFPFIMGYNVRIEDIEMELRPEEQDYINDIEIVEVEIKVRGEE